MAVKFRNITTDRLVELDEADPRVAELDRGKRWERVTGKAPVEDEMEEPVEDEMEEPAETLAEPSDADVRAWAREHDIEAPARGRLPADLLAKYRAAHA